MKQYRLKKDLPYVKAGAIYSLLFSGSYSTENYELRTVEDFDGDTLARWAVENNPDWFEPVRWKPEQGENYYSIEDLNYIYGRAWVESTYDYSLYDCGNCFKTRKEAEAARDKIKALLLSL